MKKSTIIQIVIIIILAAVLGILVKFTIGAINENNMPQMANQGINGQGGNMLGQMDENSSSIEYSGVTEITEATTIETGEYSSEKADENAILVSGNIAIDSVSKLNMTMKEDSYYEGTINEDNSANNIILKLDSSSSIKLTGDSYITSLETDDTIYSNIDFNGYKLFVNGIAIN